MPALMIASYIEARNARIWELVLCAKCYVIRSGEMMILVLPRGHSQDDESTDKGYVVFFYNTMFEVFVQKQRKC
jgi:hypothetical protein